MKETARRTFVATLVVVAVVALSLALWKLKLVIALVFLGLIIAAAMRPTVDRLANLRVPRPPRTERSCATPGSSSTRS